MTSQNLEQYIAKRYQDQLEWYSNKATINKKWYHRYQVAVAALSGIITVTVALGMHYRDRIGWQIASLIGSAVAAALVGLQKAFRFHENWVEYRTTAEQLKKERYYHAFRCGDYSSAESADRLFVERVEALISKQNTHWTTGIINSQEHGAHHDELDLPKESAIERIREQPVYSDECARGSD